MNSLRGRLSLALFLLLTAVGIAAIGGAYFVVESEPDELLDDQLRQIAMYVGDQARALPGINPFIDADDADDAVLVVIRDASGKIIRQSDQTVDLPSVAATGFSNPVVAGVEWRSYAIVTPDRLIQASQRQRTRDELANEIALQTVAPIAVLIPLSWLVLGVLITRLFRPLDTLTEELRDAPAERHGRLSTAGLPSEVAPLVDEVNGLLARQQDLLELRKRFVSDAAHQLRTPLTALKLQANILAHAPEASVVANEIDEIRQGIARMTRLTAQLLDLARAEAPDDAGALPSSDLAPILRQVIETVLPLADERSIDLGVTCEVAARLRCREQDVIAVLMNIIDNAVRYTPAGGRVDVSSELQPDGVRVVVRDSGPGVAEAELDRVFERFFRAARTPSGGAGLGLAIVKAAAARSGMDVRLKNVANPMGLRVTIEVPAAAS